MSLRRSAVASYRLLLQSQAQQWGCGWQLAGVELAAARRQAWSGCPCAPDPRWRGWQGSAGSWRHLHVSSSANAAQPATVPQTEDESQTLGEAQTHASMSTAAASAGPVATSETRAAPDLCDEALSDLRNARSKAQSRLRQQFAETSLVDRVRGLVGTAASAVRVVVRCAIVLPLSLSPLPACAGR